MFEKKRTIAKGNMNRNKKEEVFHKNRADREKEWEEKPEPKKKITVGCPIYPQCGGCIGQEEPYEKLVERKQKKLEEVLGAGCEIEPFITMTHPYHYRKTVCAAFGHDKNTGHICGMPDKKTGSVIAMETCCIDDKKATAIIVTIKELLKSFKIKTYNIKTGNGLLRYVMVRKGSNTDEIMVILVLSSDIMPSKNNFVKALRKIHPEIDTVIISENYKNSTLILGDKETTIYGKGFIKDKLGGKEFRVSSKSQFPTNPVQAEKLYSKAISLAQLSGEEIVLDAYSGIGIIGILISDQVKKVISVEPNPKYVRDAIANIKRNQIKNVDCYTKAVGEFINQVAESEKQGPDVVFMNQSKDGSDNQFMDALSRLNPKKVIYISHNLTVMEKDISYLMKKGYKPKKAVGVDMVPWSEHVESVVLMSKK